jgi:AcrR family transcriptional regulator
MVMTKTPPSSSLRERQRQEREQLILEAAEQLLAEKGYYDMAMDDIAIRVGIAKGTVYLHFPSKEALVTALMEHHLQSFLDALDAILATDQTPAAKLQAILTTALQGMVGTHYKVLLALANNTELQSQLLEKKQSLLAKRTLLMKRVDTIFAEGQARGDFDGSMPTAVLANIFWGLLSSRNYELLAQGAMTADALIAHISRFLFKGIAADAPQERKNA